MLRPCNGYHHDVHSQSTSTKDVFNVLIFPLYSYFHKIPEEVPELEKKAAHGLANPQEFSLPSPHALWTKDLYDSFDVEKIPKEKVRKSSEKCLIQRET